MSYINIESVKKDKKYTRLLNNLLQIQGQESALFTKVNSADSFDIATKFGMKFSEKIILQKDFTLNLNEKDLEKLLEIVEKSDSFIEIIQSYEMYKERLYNTKKILLENPNTFIETKKELVESLHEKIQKAKNRWLQFRRKVVDANIEENIWPLHVATFFVSINTATKTIYAPLILKEVSIEVNDSKITIASQSSWKINQKLLFIINENGFKLDEKIDFLEMGTIEIIELISSQLNLNFDPNFVINNFVNLKREDIINKIFIVHPGVVLGLFKPSGGYLRETMKKIIQNNEVDQILDADPDKSVYKKKLEKYIKENSDEILRIQKSNFSQDKALASSLIQDTIIWGPPGTGKSQVIANIIANILHKNKTVIIMSQKKAALDVLKDRLGDIAGFALFILNDNKMSKTKFYEPLQKFVEAVENSGVTNFVEKNKIISKDEIESIKVISEAKRNNTYNTSLDLINQLDEKYDLLSSIFKLNHQLTHPAKNIDLKLYLSELVKLNNIQKKHFCFYKYYPKHLKKYSKEVWLLSQDFDCDINKIAKLSKNTSYQTVRDLLNCSKKLVNENIYKSDEKYLVNFLANGILKKIRHWKVYNPKKFQDYKKFAAATRAAKRLPYKFANDHISIIKSLFQAIITTPETSFINWEKNYFDYAILDESSQIFLEIGLPILYLSKIKILAGDNKQMQPSRFFSTRDNKNDDEEDVAENAESLLDYAFDKGINKIMLDQNFRSSSASLMSFSSKQFYESKLNVIDQKIKFSSEPIVVKNVWGKWEKNANQKEAQTVIDIAIEEKDNYKSIIILAFNVVQKMLIEKIIIEQYPNLHNLIESQNLKIKNIENIQGDEADLVIISIVYDETTSISSTYVARPGGQYALNVAISRAKFKMIVVKSITSKNMKIAKSDDFKVFQDWLEFLDMNEKEKRSYSTITDKKQITESYGETESSFERAVIDEIKDKILTTQNVKIIKQYDVGNIKIDIAFLNSSNDYLLGIEVDGYHYHEGMGFDKYLDDLSRQEFLEYKGYNIYRVKEIDWKMNKQQVIKHIQMLLNNKLQN